MVSNRAIINVTSGGHLWSSSVGFFATKSQRTAEGTPRFCGEKTARICSKSVSPDVTFIIARLLKPMLILALFAGHIQAQELHFKAEFSKPSVYRGEPVTCNFVLYSNKELIEIEVAKFPEFQGFWKENILLRQGPIPLFKEPDNEMRKAVIGTYVLTPMLGESSPIIEPMKIVIRDNPGQLGDQNTVIFSSMKPLNIKALPKARKNLNFHGAVGKFTLLSPTEPLPFRTSEPLLVRLVLQGEGNFQEISEIPLTEMEGVEVLSRRALVESSGPYGVSKAFEYVLGIHRTDPFPLSFQPFVYFNPQTHRYESLAVPALLLVPATVNSATEIAEPMLHFPPPEKHWKAYASLLSNSLFVWSQIIALSVILSAVMGANLLGIWKRIRTSNSYSRRLRYIQAIKEYRLGHLENFLRIASQLACENAANQKNPAMGNDNNAAILITNYRKLVFSEHKTVDQDPQLLFDCFKETMKKETNKGFSLVELLIVLAIITFIATIGTPSYRAIVKKARKAEAKAALGLLFTAEMTFQSEYAVYGNNLSALNFSPENADRNRYSIGFPSGGGCNSATIAPSQSVQAGNILGFRFPTYFTSNFVPIFAVNGHTNCAPANIPADGGAFTATATGILTNSPFNVPVSQQDVWTMNEQAQLKNTADGTP
ncbi:MAG: BatD family protein [Deltaproteobacteria bacterium]|nr:BatD family protein [Deltaproteobacteria bacterium]